MTDSNINCDQVAECLENLLNGSGGGINIGGGTVISEFAAAVGFASGQFWIPLATALVGLASDNLPGSGGQSFSFDAFIVFTPMANTPIGLSH